MLFDKSINASGLLPQTFQLAHMLDPGLAVRLGIGRQLVFNRLGHKLAEWDAAFCCNGLGSAKDAIGNPQRSLKKAMLPHLWEYSSKWRQGSRRVFPQSIDWRRTRSKQNRR